MIPRNGMHFFRKPAQQDNKVFPIKGVPFNAPLPPIKTKERETQKEMALNMQRLIRIKEDQLNELERISILESEMIFRLRVKLKSHVNPPQILSSAFRRFVLSRANTEKRIRSALSELAKLNESYENRVSQPKVSSARYGRY